MSVLTFLLNYRLEDVWDKQIASKLRDLLASKGYFIRWSKASAWESRPLVATTDWTRIAEPVMRLYIETIDRSWIESKESALVWHHQDADLDF
ncbi:hypothetical protein IFM89_008150 [Coptis chinensis]|uniref:Uncharacterized protein n=1 Tax=Coptis chinensis TaxID=261450 RepID=A0A835IXU3_9MAGN|nr:hypothetical protein IFM89_008150 [Coptis chinensis]